MGYLRGTRAKYGRPSYGKGTLREEVDGLRRAIRNKTSEKLTVQHALKPLKTLGGSVVHYQNYSVGQELTNLTAFRSYVFGDKWRNMWLKCLFQVDFAHCKQARVVIYRPKAQSDEWQPTSFISQPDLTRFSVLSDRIIYAPNWVPGATTNYVKKTVPINLSLRRGITAYDTTSAQITNGDVRICVVVDELNSGTGLDIVNPHIQHCFCNI